MFTILDIIVFWPTLLRLFYVRRVGQIIKSFYSDSNEELAQLKQRKSVVFVFLLIAIIAIYNLTFTLVVVLVPHYRESFCKCDSIPDFIGGYVGAGVVFILEIVAYIYLMISLCTQRATIKYKIKPELLTLGSLWFVVRIIDLLTFTSTNCFFKI